MYEQVHPGSPQFVSPRGATHGSMSEHGLKGGGAGEGGSSGGWGGPHGPMLYCEHAAGQMVYMGAVGASEVQ